MTLAQAGDPKYKIYSIILHCTEFEGSDWLKFFEQPTRAVQTSIA